MKEHKYSIVIDEKVIPPIMAGNTITEYIKDHFITCLRHFMNEHDLEVEDITEHMAYTTDAVKLYLDHDVCSIDLLEFIQTCCATFDMFEYSIIIK